MNTPTAIVMDFITALAPTGNRNRVMSYEDESRKQARIVERSQAQAENLYTALRDLVEDTQHLNHHCGEAGCPVQRARDLVTEIEA